MRSILVKDQMPRRQKLARDSGEFVDKSSSLSTPLLWRDEQDVQGAPSAWRDNVQDIQFSRDPSSATKVSLVKESLSAQDSLKDKRTELGIDPSNANGLENAKLRRQSLEAKSNLTLSLFLVTFFGTACIASFGASFFIEQLLTLPALLWTAAGFGTVVAGASMVNEVRISRCSKKRQIVNALRDEVNIVSSENIKMEESINNMANEIERTKGVEQRLQNIVGRQGANVNQLVKLVKENQIIVDEMTKCVKARAMQQLINIVIRTDQSRDFTIDENEIEIMLARLRQVEYLNFDEDLFRIEMRSDNSVSGVIKLIKSLITDEWKLPDNQTGMSFMFKVSQDHRGSLVKSLSTRDVLPNLQLLESIAEHAHTKRR